MTPDQEKEFRARLEAEQAAESPEDAAFRERFQADVAAMQERLVSPAYGIVGGAVAGPFVGRGMAAYAEGADKAKSQAAAARAGSPGQKWAAKTGFGEGTGETVREVSDEFKARREPVGSGKISKTIPKNEPLSIEAYQQQKAKEAAEAALREREKSYAQRFVERNPRMGSAASGAANVLSKGVPPFIGRVGAGGMAGYQAVDAYNRMLQGDVPGAVVSGTGSIGALSAMHPNPKKRALGILSSAIAELVNQNRDPGIIEKPVEMPEVPKFSEGRRVPKSKKGIIQEAVRGGLDMLKPRRPVNLEDLEGKTIIGTMSDRTAVDLGRGLRGGPWFPSINEGAAWAVDSPGAASRLLNAVNAAGGPEKAVVAPMLMSPVAHRSNRDVARMALSEFQKNMGEGRVSPQRIAEIQGMVQKIPKMGGLPDVTDPRIIDELQRMTFKQRGDLVDKLGSKPKTAPVMDLERLLKETMEPDLRGTELGAIGPSMFKLSGHRSVDPSLHGSYSHILHGDLLGEMPTLPRQFVFRDLEARAIKELGRPLSDYNYRTSVGIPSQRIDDKLLKSWDELGFLKPKTGGVNNPE